MLIISYPRIIIFMLLKINSILDTMVKLLK